MCQYHSTRRHWLTSSLFVTNPLISEATVVIKCTTYRTNTVDIPPIKKHLTLVFLFRTIFHSSSNKWFDQQYTNIHTHIRTHTHILHTNQISLSLFFIHLFMKQTMSHSQGRCHLASCYIYMRKKTENTNSKMKLASV